MQQNVATPAMRGLGSRSFVAERGFTLLELLLAVGIFGIVLAAINTVFFSAMRLRNKTTASLEESLPIQQTLAMLKRDLQGLMVPGTIAGPFQTATASDVMAQQGGTVFYTCTAPVNDTTPFADVQKVSYTLRQPENNQSAGRDLVRLVNRNILATQEQGVEQWLMGGVERLQLSYYDGNSWKETWDSTVPDLATGQTNLLPRAIKVQLQLASNYGEGRKLPVEIVVPVVVQARSNQVQNASSGGQQ